MTQWETLVFVPNETVRQPIKSRPPPDPDAFMRADDEQRLILLGEAYIRQTQAVGTCNVQIQGLNKWVTEILNAYPDADVRYRVIEKP